MQKLLIALAATTALTGTAMAQDAITEFNIGILGGENAQDRMTSNECFRVKMEEALGVPVKLFTPADYDGVIQGLLGGTLDYAWLGASAYTKIYLTDPEARLYIWDENGTAAGFALFCEIGHPTGRVELRRLGPDRRHHILRAILGHRGRRPRLHEEILHPRREMRKQRTKRSTITVVPYLDHQG